MSSPQLPNIFHETFLESSNNDPRGLWPNLHVTRTVSAGVIVPLSDAFEYGGFYLQQETIIGSTPIIEYVYSDPVNLSDIDDFRILFDSSVTVQFTIDVIDTDSNQTTYTNPAGASTGLIYNASISSNLSRINPAVYVLSKGTPSNANPSSIKRIHVKLSPVGSSITSSNLVVIYAITTGYDSSKYSDLNSGFRDVFARLQSSSSSPFPASSFPSVFAYSVASIISSDKTMVPVSSRELNGDLISVESFFPSRSVSSAAYTAGCLAAVNKGLCVLGRSNTASTLTATYTLNTPVTLSSGKINLQLAYYTQNGVDNDPNSRFTMTIQLSNSSGGTPLKILNTAFMVTQRLFYRYFFTDAEFFPIPPGGTSYDTLTITIGNVKSFASGRFVATPTGSPNPPGTFRFDDGGEIMFPSDTIQSISDGSITYYFLPKGSAIVFYPPLFPPPLPPPSIVIVLYDTIFTKNGGTQTGNTITFSLGDSIFFPYGLAFSGSPPAVGGNRIVSPLPSFLALEYIAINFKRYNMAQSIPQFS